MDRKPQGKSMAERIEVCYTFSIIRAAAVKEQNGCSKERKYTYE